MESVGIILSQLFDPVIILDGDLMLREFVLGNASVVVGTSKVRLQLNGPVIILDGGL